MIENNLEYEDLGEEKKQIIFFRPGLRDFLEMARENGRITLAIWTYSERNYANDIAKIICNKFNLPPDTFIFKYGAEDIEDDDMPKSLNKIWNNPVFGNKFNKFNTFLVDDRYGNLCHEINVANSILVQAFAPFGESKQREPLTRELLEKAIDDDIFYELTKITKNLLDDIDGCDDEEIEESFKTEAIFAPKCIERKKLENYVQQYADNIQLCTIGEVEHAASVFKGGRLVTHKSRRRSGGRKSGRKSGRRTRHKKYKGYTKKCKKNRVTKKR
jgi:hypothetical protein